MIIRVTDSGSPPLSHEREVFIVVLPRPEIGPSAAGSLLPGTTAGFRFGTVAGRRYQIEYTDSLSSPNWLPWSASFVAEGDSVEFYETTVHRQRFYRVRDVTPP